MVLRQLLHTPAARGNTIQRTCFSTQILLNFYDYINYCKIDFPSQSVLCISTLIFTKKKRMQFLRYTSVDHKNLFSPLRKVEILPQ